MSTNENQADRAAEYDLVADRLRTNIAEHKHSLAVRIAAVDELRSRYRSEYQAWWESTRRTNGMAGGVVPSELAEFGDRVAEQQRELLDCSSELHQKRRQYLSWAQFRELEEVEHCRACSYRGLIPIQQRYVHSMECVVCGHEQVVHDLRPYQDLPDYDY